MVAIISMIPLAMISSNSNSGSDSGLWAYSIILGMALAPILSLITTIKLNKKEKHTEIVEQVNNNNDIQKNKTNPFIIIAIVIVSLIGIGILLSGGKAENGRKNRLLQGRWMNSQAGTGCPEPCAEQASQMQSRSEPADRL